MNRIAQRRIKDDIKKHPRNSLYKKQINVLINKDVLNQGKRYLVILNFLADQEKSLIDIFLHFFDSIYQIKVSPTTSKIYKSINYNKTFKFLVKLYFLLDKFLPRVVKPTQQEIVSEMDIVGKNKSFYLDGESTKTNLQNFINKQKIQINNNFEQLLILAKKTQKQSQQIIKYGIVLKMCQQQKQKTIQQIMKIEDQAIKSIYIPLQMQDMPRIYLQRLLDILISIRFTKKLYKLTNFSNFIENIYKNYYKTQSQGIANIRDNSVTPKKFILKRYTNNDNEVLMNIFDLVQIRAKNIKYEQQSYQISKQLLKQLISHKNITKTYHPYLSPTSILFNQISLNVQLSYQNPLLNSLGLLQRPTNMENMICFQATPKFYDSFASINELMNPDLLANYLIDVIKYFKDSQEGDNQHPLLKIKQKQGNKSQVWRFMMTVYYIMNGQQYYRGKQSKKIQTLCQLKKFVQQQDSKLNNPRQIYYLQLFGTKFTNLLAKKNHKSQFYHNIYFFQDLFDRSQNSNDYIRQYGSVKSQQYLKNFNKIIREILLLIENQTISKVYNTVIYLLRFYIGIFRQFYQIYYLCRFCIKKVELGYKFLDDYMNKAQNQLANLSKHHFKVAFSKLRQYIKRYETRRQSQITYILQKYKQQFQGISMYYDLMVSVKSQLSLIILQGSKKYANLGYQIQNDQIKQKILILKRRLGQSLYVLKRRIKNIINNEFLMNQHRRNINQQTKYYKNKLKLYTTAAFQMNFYNFIIIESIVLPILNTGQFSNKNSRNNQKGIQDYRQLNDLCEYSLQILLDGSQQTDQINQSYSEQNWKQQAVKQHRY